MSAKVETWVQVTCDGCGLFLTSDNVGWMLLDDMPNELSEELWTWKQSPSLRVGRNHRCPDCQKEQADG